MACSWFCFVILSTNGERYLATEIEPELRFPDLSVIEKLNTATVTPCWDHPSIQTRVCGQATIDKRNSILSTRAHLYWDTTLVVHFRVVSQKEDYYTVQLGFITTVITMVMNPSWMHKAGSQFNMAMTTAVNLILFLPSLSFISQSSTRFTKYKATPMWWCGLLTLPGQFCPKVEQKIRWALLSFCFTSWSKTAQTFMGEKSSHFLGG